jgi:hypothetical protein
LAYSSTMKMEATHSSKTSVNFQLTTQHYILEDRTFLVILVANLLFHVFIASFCHSYLEFNKCKIISSTF